MTVRRRKSFGASAVSTGAASGAPLYSITRKFGGKFLKNVPQIFTADKAHFIVLTSLELRVYLLATRQCIRSIPIASTDTVTDMQYFAERDQVLIVRSSGQCDVIDWREKQVDSNYMQFGYPVSRIAHRPHNKDSFLVVTNHPPGSDSGDLALVSHNIQSGQAQLLSQHKGAKLFAVSSSGRYYAFSIAHKKGHAVVVGETDGSSVVREKIHKRLRPTLSLAVSDEGIVAVGSASGVIDVYYRALQDGEPAIRALKWHIDSVLSLSFSLDGDYLVSGGKEKVLVFWQLDTDNTQFLPRLDGEIQSIVVDPSSELYALTLGDNQVLVLSSLDLLSRLQVSGIKAVYTKLPNDPEKEKRKRKNKAAFSNTVGDYTAAFFVHPRTGNAYFPTQSGSQLQIYDTVKDEQLSVISITSTIQTGKVRTETLIDDPKITNVCFSKDGQWMATVDEATPPPIDKLFSKNDKEIYLKFWYYSPKSSKWELATRVAAPHGQNKSIIDICNAEVDSTTNTPAFLTAAQDGGVRLWKPSNVQEIGSTTRTVSWSVRKILSPGGMTSGAVSVAWADDGSFFVLAFESSLYLCDGAKFTIIRPLPNLLGSRVRSVKIVSRFVVALSKTRLVVYDLIDGHQVWSVRVNSPSGGKRLLAVDPINQRICLACNYFAREFHVESKVFVFECESPLPVHVESYGDAMSAVNWIPGTANFCLLDAGGRLLTFGGSTSAGPSISDATDDITTLYHIKQQQAMVAEESDDGQAVSSVLNINSFDKVFDGSTEYSLDNLELLFDKVLSVVNPRNN